MPKSMLPQEVEKTLKKLGDDGEKVRGTLEREFANYLDEKAPQRARSATSGPRRRSCSAASLKPVVTRLGKQLAERALDPDAAVLRRGPASASARTPERRRRQAQRRRGRPAATTPPRSERRPLVASPRPPSDLRDLAMTAGPTPSSRSTTSASRTAPSRPSTASASRSARARSSASSARTAPARRRRWR